MSRSKDQWIERTGGFRIGESPEQFKKRVAEIVKIEKRLKTKPTMKDIERLRFLNGTTDERGNFVGFDTGSDDD